MSIARLRLRLLASLAAAWSCSLAVQGADWPGFRGPTSDGHVAGSSAPLHWSDGAGVLWQTPLPGPGASSPIVASGRIYLACYSGYGVDGPEQAGDPSLLRRHAVCLDLADGRILWNHESPTPGRETQYQGPYVTLHGYASSTPATDGERVYFFHGPSGVFAYTLDGDPVWQADVGSGVHEWGAGTSPVLFEDLLIINASVESDALLALDRRTGELVWRATGFPRAWNTPLVVETPEGGRELVVSIRGRVRAFDPATGTELWTCRGINAAELCPSPVAADGVVYVLGHPRGEALAVRAGGRGDVTATHVLWSLNKGSNVGSPLYHEGRLYWTNDRQGLAYCVDAASGEILYEQRMTPRPDRIYASPLLVDDKLYYVSRNQGTYVVTIGPEYRLLAHNRLPDDASPFNASPAVVDGKLLLRSDRYLYCIAESP